MINSIFFGYLSPQWKRLVRTIVILNLIVWIMLVIAEGDSEFVPAIIILTIVNLVLSYVSELFVKIKQESEVGLSILCLLINIILTILLVTQ